MTRPSPERVRMFSGLGWLSGWFSRRRSAVERARLRKFFQRTFDRLEDRITPVAGAAPTLRDLQLSQSVVYEGQAVQLSGTIEDADVNEQFTLVINWGDGLPTTTHEITSTGQQTPFQIEHVVPDDGQSASPVNVNHVAVTVYDSQSHSQQASVGYLVAVNQNPTLESLTINPDAARVGSPVTLTGLISDPGLLDTFNLTIFWGDGANTVVSGLDNDADGVDFSHQHVYSAEPTSGTNFVVQVVVGDDDSGTAIRSIVVPVQSAPKFASLNAASVDENNEITLTGEIVHPSLGSAFSIQIDWGDGTSESIAQTGSGLAATPFSVPHLYQDNRPGDAPYEIRLTVLDEYDLSSNAETSVVVRNRAPVLASLSAAPGGEGEATTLNIQLMDPGPLDSYTLAIHWGDGSTQTLNNLPAGQLTLQPTHHYVNNLPGNLPYDIQIILTDNDGASTTQTLPAAVVNLPPSLVQISAADVDENGISTVSGIFTDPGSNDTQFAISVDWGDGYTSLIPDYAPLGNNTYQFTAEHRFLNNLPGDAAFQVKVKVTDSDGGEDDDTASVKVTNLAPYFTSLSTTPTVEGAPATLSGRFHDDGTLDAHKVFVDWGDGTSESFDIEAGVSEFSKQHLYRNNLPGNAAYVVSVTVVDDDGAEYTQSVDQIILNEAPQLVTLTTNAISENQIATLSGTFADAGIDDVHDIVIDWGDGTSETISGLTAGTYAFEKTHRYLDDPGVGTTFTIHVTIADEVDAVEQTLAQTVTNSAPNALVLTPSTSSLMEGETVDLHGVFSDPGTLDSHTLTVDWGDGKVETFSDLSPTRQFDLTHQYSQFPADGGPYVIRATIRDNGGLAIESTTSVQVIPLVPTLVGIHLPTRSDPGQPVSLLPVVVGTGNLSYRWRITSPEGYNLQLSGASPSFAPPALGTYTVTAELLIDGVVSGSKSATTVVDFSDSFNRADNLALGAAWRENTDFLRIADLQVTSAGGGVATLVGVNNKNASVSFDVALGNAANEFALALARYLGPASTNLIAGGIHKSGSRYYAALYSNVGGVLTTLGQANLTSGTGRLRMDVFGGQIRLFVDDQLQLTAAADARLVSGSVGIALSPGSKIDNFHAQARELISHQANEQFTAAFSTGSLSDDYQILSGNFAAANGTLSGPQSGNLFSVYGYSQADQIVSSNVRVAALSNAAAALYARHQSAGDRNAYVAFVTQRTIGNTQQFRAELYANVNGAWITLGVSAPLQSATVALAGELKLEAIGTTIRVLWNDRLVLQALDSRLQGPGTAGLYLAGSAAQADSFQVRKATPTPQVIENFNGYQTGGFLDNRWTMVSGSFTGSGGGVVANSAANFAVLNLGTNSATSTVADTLVEANLRTASQMNAYAALVARYSGPAEKNFYLASLSRRADGMYVELFKNVNGGYTLLNKVKVSSDTGLLSLQIVGSALTLRFQEQIVLTHVDVNILNGTGAGMYATAQSTVDDFRNV